MANSKRDTLVITVFPINDKGQVSLSQRLIGQVSNGDIARMNFSGDYKPHLLRVEKIDREDAAVLDLRKIAKWVTYDKIIL